MQKHRNSDSSFPLRVILDLGVVTSGHSKLVTHWG
jgi:hypothetical protein